jgi:hypothetical protein
LQSPVFREAYNYQNDFLGSQGFEGNMALTPRAQEFEKACHQSEERLLYHPVQGKWVGWMLHLDKVGASERQV